MIARTGRKPTWKTGFARSAGESASPSLWKGLVGAWVPSLGPTGLTLRDQSLNKNIAALTNMDAATDWVVGEKGHTLNFADDATQHVLVSVTSLNTIYDLTVEDAYGISAWIRPTATQGVNTGIFTVAVDHYFMGMETSNKVRTWRAKSGFAFAESATVLINNRWYHVAGTYDGVTLRVYIDGIEDGSTSAAGPIDAPAAGGGSEGVFIGRYFTSNTFEGDIAEVLLYNKPISPNHVKQLFTLGPGGIFTRRRQIFFSIDQITAAITGTATVGIVESDIVDGGKTIIITLTGDTWVASGGTFDAQRQAIIDGLDSAQVESTGWNAEVRDKQGVDGVVRTSDEVVTITLDAQGAYDITAQETITVTVPASALVTSSTEVIGSPTFTVATEVTAGRAQLIFLTGEPG